MSTNNGGAVNGDKVVTGGFFDSVLTPPEWLNKSYVEKALSEFTNDADLKINEYSIAPCTKPGDNFVGVIFRAKINYTTKGATKSESFIVKIEPFLEGFKKDLMADQPFFNTEGRMYTKMLPIMQSLLANSGDDEVIAPGLIHYNADQKVLIFQDISPDQFVMQHLPVNFEKSSKIAKKLGKFHAVSYYLNQEGGQVRDLITSFTDGFFCEKLAAKFDFFQLNMMALCELTREWKMDTISEKLTALMPVFLKKMMDMYRPTGNGLNVLNHGDFHIRNLLFKYPGDDQSQFEAIRFIDFQLCVYATPAIDLSYLLYMNADNDCREGHRDELLKVYHDQFLATLNGLGFIGKAPTLLDFQVELLKNGMMEFFVATNFLTMFYMDHSKFDGIDFTDKNKMMDLSKELYDGPVFKPLLQKLLPEFFYKGILDV